MKKLLLSTLAALSVVAVAQLDARSCGEKCLVPGRLETIPAVTTCECPVCPKFELIPAEFKQAEMVRIPCETKIVKPKCKSGSCHRAPRHNGYRGHRKAVVETVVVE